MCFFIFDILVFNRNYQFFSIYNLKNFVENYLNILVLLPTVSCNWMHALAYSIEICCLLGGGGVGEVN